MIFAKGLRLWVLTAYSDAKIIVAAPSLILEALAAVIVPFLVNAVFKDGILSLLNLFCS